MARMTVAQLREKELRILVTYKTSEPTEEDYKEARRNMNSFYRLCGLCETNLNLANNEKWCNTSYAKRSKEREINWHKRLDKIFRDTYGLNLVYCGYMPSIGVENGNRGFSERISTYFYD